VQALLVGASDGDVTIAELLEHCDLGTLPRPEPESLTP
jgi:alpha-acetolactate decarboxylase